MSAFVWFQCVSWNKVRGQWPSCLHVISCGHRCSPLFSLDDLSSLCFKDSDGLLKFQTVLLMLSLCFKAKQVFLKSLIYYANYHCTIFHISLIIYILSVQTITL